MFNGGPFTLSVNEGENFLCAHWPHSSFDRPGYKNVSTIMCRQYRYPSCKFSLMKHILRKRLIN